MANYFENNAEDDEGGNDIPIEVDNQEFQDNYKDALHSLAKKWFYTQMKHKVSATAANRFWSLSMSSVPVLHELWERQGISKPITGFINERNKLYDEFCPDVIMQFAFQNKLDGSIHNVTSSSAPFKAYDRNPNFVKLYEMASVKVIMKPPFLILV